MNDIEGLKAVSKVNKIEKDKGQHTIIFDKYSKETKNKGFQNLLDKEMEKING